MLPGTWQVADHQWVTVTCSDMITFENANR